MRDVFAYTFRSPFSLAEVRAKLIELGPWTWIERDSDRLGGYISARVLEAPQRGMVKIFAEGDHFAINVLLQSDEPDATSKFAGVREAVFKRLLPAVEATALLETETYE